MKLRFPSFRIRSLSTVLLCAATTLLLLLGVWSAETASADADSADATSARMQALVGQLRGLVDTHQMEATLKALEPFASDASATSQETVSDPSVRTTTLVGSLQDRLRARFAGRSREGIRSPFSAGHANQFRAIIEQLRQAGSGLSQPAAGNYQK